MSLIPLWAVRTGNGFHHRWRRNVEFCVAVCRATRTFGKGYTGWRCKKALVINLSLPSSRHGLYAGLNRSTGWPRTTSALIVRLTANVLSSSKILTAFQTFFTLWIRKIFVIILSLKIPPHLKCVATLPCDMSMSLKQQLKTRRLL